MNVLEDIVKQYGTSPQGVEPNPLAQVDVRTLTAASTNGHVQSLNATAKQPAPPLWNRSQPHGIRQKEMLWHRAAIHLAAKGFAANEIAETLGKDARTVREILLQPALQQTLTDETRRVFGEDHEVVEVIRQGIVGATKALVEIARHGEKESSRIAAANSLLDRRYGKPNQPINRGTDVDLASLSDAELAAMLPATASTATSK